MDDRLQHRQRERQLRHTEHLQFRQHTGSAVVGYTNDVWVYDPAQNQWEWVSGSTTVPGAGQALAPTYGPSGELSATNTPGGRHRAASWTDGNGNLWLFGGSSGSTLYGDLWMWDHTAQQWAWIEGGQGA